MIVKLIILGYGTLLGLFGTVMTLYELPRRELPVVLVCMLIFGPLLVFSAKSFVENLKIVTAPEYKKNKVKKQREKVEKKVEKPVRIVKAAVPETVYNGEKEDAKQEALEYMYVAFKDLKNANWIALADRENRRHVSATRKHIFIDNARMNMEQAQFVLEDANCPEAEEVAAVIAMLAFSDKVKLRDALDVGGAIDYQIQTICLKALNELERIIKQMRKHK